MNNYYTSERAAGLLGGIHQSQNALQNNYALQIRTPSLPLSHPGQPRALNIWRKEMQLHVLVLCLKYLTEVVSPPDSDVSRYIIITKLIYSILNT
jgi:hypothetical protein